MSLFTEFPEELLLHIAGYVAPAAGLGYAPYVALALTCRRFYVLLASWIAYDQTRLFKQMVSAEAQSTITTGKSRCRVVSSTRKLVTVLDQTTSSELHENWTQNDSEEHTDPDAIPSRSFAFAQDPFIRSIKSLRCIIGGTEKEFQIVLGVISRAPHLQHVHLELVEETSSYRQAARALNVCAAKARLELTVSGVISDYFERGPFEVRGRQRKRADEAAIPSCSDVDHQRLTKSTRERRKSRSLLAPLSELFSQAREPSYLILSVRENPQRLLREQVSYSYKFTPIPPSLRLRLAPHPHLSSFTLRSDSLFYPNLYPLTLHLLNTARIRTLFLASSRMSLHDWAHILQSLTMPELKALSVGQVAIAFPDLLAFLVRHPSIEKLELGSPDVTGTVKVPQAQGISLLPRLASLTAHREHLVPFIQLKKHGHVPSLRHFSVIVDGFDVLSPLASPEEPFLELLFQEVHFEDLSIDFWTPQGYLIFVRWLLYRVRVRLDTTSESKLPSASRHKFELGNLTAVSALVKQWDIGRCLTEWMKDGLDAWALEHASAVEFTRNRRKADDGMLDEYLIISESLILSVCPKLEKVVYNRV